MGVKKDAPSQDKAIDILRGQFRADRTALELDGITLYFPALTGRAIHSVAEKMGDKPDNVSEESWRFERNVMLVIHQAETEDGKKAFAFGHKSYLMDEIGYSTLQKMILTVMTAGAVPNAPQTVEQGKADSAKI